MRIAPFVAASMFALSLNACGFLDAIAEQKGEQALDVAGPVEVHVATFNGSVAVARGPAGRVSVTWTKRGSGPTQKDAEADLENVEVRVASEGGRVRVAARRTDGRSSGSSGASFVVTVPAETPLKLQSSNGSLAARGVGAAVNAQTSNGAIRVEAGAGPVEARTSNGSVEVSGEGLRLSVESSNGSLRIDGSLADGSHTLRTENGRIEVALPAAARFRLLAHTSNGRVTCDFPLAGGEWSGRSELEGSAGADPKATLTLATSNGAIHLRRRG